jgi:hypothetical protein
LFQTPTETRKREDLLWAVKVLLKIDVIHKIHMDHGGNFLYLLVKTMKYEFLPKGTEICKEPAPKREPRRESRQ